MNGDGQASKQLDQQEHNSDAGAKRVVPRLFDSATGTWQNQSLSTGKLVYEQFDYIARVLADSTTETYTYKLGGSGGTTVATVTIVYTASDLATIISITQIGVSIVATGNQQIISTSTGPLPTAKGSPVILLLDGSIAIKTGSNIYISL